MAPLILKIGIRWRLVVSITLQPIYSREGTPVPIEQEAVWATQPVWTFWPRGKVLARNGTRTPDRAAVV
jgi:hypothetical protein